MKMEDSLQHAFPVSFHLYIRPHTDLPLQNEGSICFPSPALLHPEAFSYTIDILLVLTVCLPPTIQLPAKTEPGYPHPFSLEILLFLLLHISIFRSDLHSFFCA